MSSEFSLRPFQDEDAQAPADMQRGTVQHVNARDYAPEIIEHWVSGINAQHYRASAKEFSRTVAARPDGTIIGFGDCHTGKSTLGIYVHKDYQGQGVGATLMNHLLDKLYAAGCTVIELDSTLTARTFYEHHGFEVIEEKNHDMRGVPVPVLRMRKVL